jgi:hypothetical protein
MNDCHCLYIKDQCHQFLIKLCTIVINKSPTSVSGHAVNLTAWVGPVVGIWIIVHAAQLFGLLGLGNTNAIFEPAVF